MVEKTKYTPKDTIISREDEEREDKEIGELWNQEPKFNIKDPILGVLWVYENGKSILGREGVKKMLLDEKSSGFWLGIFLDSTKRSSYADKTKEKKIEDAITFLKSLKG